MTQPTLDNLCFLVVEDESFQRETLIMLLKGCGARTVLQAENGLAALELLDGSERPVDIVLSDLDMPEMDGMALLRHLATRHPGVSVILVSAMSDALLHSVEAMATAYDLSFLGAVPKPPGRAKLLSLIAGYSAQPARHAAAAAKLGPDSEELIAALDNGEIVVYVQPKVDMVGGRVVGVEGLVRWDSPTRGLTAPHGFLDAIESFGLMDKLTTIVLAQAFAHYLDWQAQGHDLSISVNISPSSLADPAMAKRLSELVSGMGLTPAVVILEITESVVLSAVGTGLENLARLSMLGFGLSIDDYGTGYSSQQSLSRVPFTELKIDRTFVTGAAGHNGTRIIVESSLDLAHRLGLKVTAEGIETPEQWAMLRGMGCDIAQGYLIAKPMPANQLVGWLQGWRPPLIDGAPGKFTETIAG